MNKHWDKVWNALDLEASDDLVKTELGILSGRSPEIPPYAYKIKMNFGLDEKDLGSILSFNNGACERVLVDLYSNFNGFDFGMSKTVMYGLIKRLDRSDYFVIQNVPFDVEQLQVYGRPDCVPENRFVFATSVKKGDQLGFQEVFYSVDCNGKIHATDPSDNRKDQKSFLSIDAWLDEMIELGVSSS